MYLVLLSIKAAPCTDTDLQPRRFTVTRYGRVPCTGRLGSYSLLSAQMSNRTSLEAEDSLPMWQIVPLDGKSRLCLCSKTCILTRSQSVSSIASGRISPKTLTATPSQWTRSDGYFPHTSTQPVLPDARDVNKRIFP